MFFFWTHAKEKLASFLNVCNNYHPNIKFTHESDKEHIPFLDRNVKLSGNRLSGDLYIKSTDRYRYLHYISSHSEHAKNLQPRFETKSNLLRKKDFKKHICEMKSWFSQRG